MRLLNKYYADFIKYLGEENKEEAFRCAMQILKETGVVKLYEEILAPGLNSVIDEFGADSKELIWREHVRSGIIKTIVENSYSFVLDEREKIGIKHNENIIVLCPKFEEHEIGARMAADFFTIAGFKTTHIGANTPEDTLSLAVEKLKPKYISISVTNYYNLIEAKRAIDKLRQKDNYSGKIILGGHAFSSDPQVYKRIGGDYLLSNFNEILKFSKEVNL